MAKRGLPRATFAFLTGVGLAGCGLITGIGDLEVDDSAFDAATDTRVQPRDDGSVLPGPTDGGADARDAADPDTSIFGNNDAQVVDACSPQGCVTIPIGFQLVAFGTSGAACPTGFESPTEVVGDTGLGANACTCDCAVGTQPKCPDTGSGIITASFTNMPEAGLTCSNNSGDVSGGCATDGFLGNFQAGNSARRYIPPSGGPTGGTCTATAKKDATKLSSTKSRLCQASVIPQCGAQVCPPALTGSFKACIAATGAATCPVEFPNAKSVGTAADFTCGASCGCDVTGNCSGGVLQFYSNVNCNGAPGLTLAVNGNCNLTPAPGGNYDAHRYVANPPTGVACNKTGNTTPSAVQLTQLTTVCCN